MLVLWKEPSGEYCHTQSCIIQGHATQDACRQLQQTSADFFLISVTDFALCGTGIWSEIPEEGLSMQFVSSSVQGLLNAV